MKNKMTVQERLINWNTLQKMIFIICIVFMATHSLSAQQAITVTGMVTDEVGVPLTGTSIIVKSTSTGVISDINGHYTITVPGKEAVLIFSFVGFDKQEIVVGDRTTLNVTLREGKELEEVVVVAYGVQKKASLTGAVSSVQSKELRVSSSASMANALAGRISGLTSVQRGGGQPGRDDASLYLRGAATTNGTNPLILIDGVPRDNIRTIDPNEVESISILKDASATAVFGVRGANGVILITTRRGKEGKPELTINATQSFSAFTREPSRLHSLDYLQLRNEALHNDGRDSEMFSQKVFDKYSNPLLGLDPSDPDFAYKADIRRYMYPDHDYYREMIARWSPQSVVNANLSGGTAKVTYFMNVGYMHQGGNLKTEPEALLGYDPSLKLDRYSFRSNVDYKITPKLTAFLNLATYIEKVNMPQTAAVYNNDQGYMMRDIFYKILTTLPISPGPATIAGFGVPAGLPLDPTYLDSGNYLSYPVYERVNWSGYEEETRANLNSTVGLKWDLDFITQGLSAKGSLSYDAFATTILSGERWSRIYRAFVDIDTDEMTFSDVSFLDSRLTLSKSAKTRYTLNAQGSLEYNRKFGSHDVGGLILTQRDYWESISSELPYNVVSLAARATYNYDSRYFGEVNMGYNGSEQFAPTKRFGFFPAFSMGWAISNESFLKDNKILTYLKLRASTGRVGNDKMGGSRFLYQDNITMNSSGYIGSLSQGASVSEGLLGNPELTWELAQKSNIGVDFQIINDLTGSMDVFTEDRTQILIQRRSIVNLQGLPLSSIPRVNMGEVKNKGFEVELTYMKKVNQDLQLTARGNIGYNRNKLIFVDEVPRDETYKYQTRETGFPLGQAFGYEIDWKQGGGYWTPETLAANSLTYDFGTPRPGDFVYIDANEDGTINEKDMVPIGHGSIPRITWGGSLSAQYKGFDAYIFFQGLSKFDSEMGAQGTYENIIRGTYFDYHRTAWTEEKFRNGDKITYPALSAGETVNHVANSFFIQNRSFTRLKNVEIGYTLQENLLTVVGIRQMRVFVSGQNVFTWSPKFRSWHLDPETDGATSYPQTKTFSLGVNITF